MVLGNCHPVRCRGRNESRHVLVQGLFLPTVFDQHDSITNGQDLVSGVGVEVKDRIVIPNAFQGKCLDLLYIQSEIGDPLVCRFLLFVPLVSFVENRYVFEVS